MAVKRRKAKMKKQIALIGIALLTMAILFSGCVQEQPVQGEETIKIGVLLPLTGPAAEYGTASQKGLILAQRQLNETRGAGESEIELLIENSECDTKKAIAAFNKLVEVDGVKVVIGDICSSATLALAPIAEEKKVVLISPGSSNPSISQAGDYVFRTWPSDDLQGKFLAKFVSEEFPGAKVAVIYINNDYGKGLEGVFSENFLGEIVASEAFEESATDFRTQILKVKEAGPQVVLLASFAKEIGRILKQAKELDLEAQFIGGEGTKDQTVLDAAGNAAEGLIGTIPHVKETETRKRFMEAFEKEFGEEPGITGDAAYDALFIIVKTMRACGNTSECVKGQLYALEGFEGASGKISFDKNGDIKKGYDLVTIKNGEFVLYEGGSE